MTPNRTKQRQSTFDPADTPIEKTLYLIDGHAQIFRAYFAVRTPMTSPVTGEPTNAVFAFTGMLLKLFDQFHPQYVAMPIDTAGPTFRDELYEDYKANRDPAPDELVQQFDRIFEMTRLFGIPLLGHSGAEADDVIATIVQRILDDPNQSDMHIRIVSKDKDLEQLLGPRVTMFDIHTDTTIDTLWLKENKGIQPSQVVDILALTGDKVDNVPGVEGVGPKTAAKLILEYESLDGILANLDKIKGKRRENIEKARDQLPLSRQLVTLKRDVDIPFDLADAQVGAIDATQLQRLFKEMGFRRHQTQLDRLLDTQPAHTPGAQTSDDAMPTSLFDAGLVATPQCRSDAAASSPFTTAADYEYEIITTLEQLQNLTTSLRCQKIISVDTETIGLGHRAALCGLSFSWKIGHGAYVPVRSPNPADHLDIETVLNTLRPVLEDPTVPKTGHNLKYDLLVLRHAGVRMQGVVFDSLIASHLVGSPSHSLDSLSLGMLNHEMTPISQLIGPRPKKTRGQDEPKQKTMDQVTLDLITPYAAEDADMALRLYEQFSPQLSELEMNRLTHDVEMPLVEVLADMEFHGVRVDCDILTKQKEQLAQRISDLRDDIQEKAGQPFNVDSPKQLGEILFERLKLPVVKKTKTGPSTDSEVLETLAAMPDLTPEQASVPTMVGEYRQLTKLVNTYLDNLRDSVDAQTGRVHATFLQTGAATGRLSSNNPNLQNIPIRTDVGRQIRSAFVAEKGHVLMSADYSQVELRMLAHLSEDTALLDAFDKDMDIHTAVAASVFNTDPAHVTADQRGQAKTINFGIIYGISAFGLARRVGNLDRKSAGDLIADYRHRFPGIDAFLMSCIEQATLTGYVTTILGRRRPIPQIQSSNQNTRNLGERLAINTVVQGSAADLIKIAMVNLHRRIQREQLPMKLLLQIHDELVLETDHASADAMSQIVRHEMQTALALKTPLKVDIGIGPTWLAAK